MPPSSKKKSQKNIESGDQNWLAFLIKILNNHFPENKWDSTHQSLKLEKKSQKISWRQILTDISSKALHNGINSLEGQTLSKLLEIAPNVENYLTKDKRDIIKFKESKGKKNQEIFIFKCKTQITPSFKSLMVRVIEDSGFGKKFKDEFLNSMRIDNLGINFSGEEVYQNELQLIPEPGPVKKIHQTNDFSSNTFNSKEVDSLEEEKQDFVVENFKNSKFLQVKENKNMDEECLSEYFYKSSLNENDNEQLCNDNINFNSNQGNFNTQIYEQKNFIMFEKIQTEQLYQKNYQIYQMNEEISRKNEEIRQKDEEIRQKDEEIRQKNEKNRQKDILLAEKDKTIDNLIKTITQHEKDKNLL